MLLVLSLVYLLYLPRADSRRAALAGLRVRWAFPNRHGPLCRACAVAAGDRRRRGGLALNGAAQALLEHVRAAIAGSGRLACESKLALIGRRSRSDSEASFGASVAAFDARASHEWPTIRSRPPPNKASAAETIGARSVPAPAPMDEVTIEDGLEVGQAVEDLARLGVRQLGGGGGCL